MSKAEKIGLPCPNCPSSDAYCTYPDGSGYCWSCKAYVNPNRLGSFLGIDYKVDAKVDTNTLKHSKDSILGNTNTTLDTSIYTKEEFTYQFLPFRSLSHGTVSFYNIKTKVDSAGKPVSVGFLYPDMSYKVRLLDRKEFYSTGKVSPCLFGRNLFGLGSHKYVTITEGEIDAASLYQVLRSPVVSVHSSSSAERDCIADREYLSSFERIYLAFDNDAPGREAVRKVAKLFDYNKLYVVKFDRFKDANEYLEAGAVDELRNLWWNSKRFCPETIISSFSEFEKILNEEPVKGVPYPFPTLTEMTYGIRTGESVLITAQEGIGKTELMHAIEHKLLKETSHAVGAIFLEEPKRRHLQALAGIELNLPVHLPDTGVSDGATLVAVQSLISQDDRLHIYNHFGSDDPEVLIDTIRFLVAARGCRYILLDHITMAVSGRNEDDERRALDYLATKLEMMVVELNFALIVVSHVNDFGQTRGSRYISKIANIRIDLKRDVMNEDLIEKNTTYLSVSKNRFCGKTGSAGRVLFNLSTNTYTELAANDNGCKDMQRAV